MQYDAVIAYRCYPKVSKHPFKRSDNKLKMICWGLSSLRRCIGNLKVKFYIIDDACPPERKTQIIESIQWCDYAYLNTNRIGNAKTFMKQVEILSDQNESDIVYFAEDDYLYDGFGFWEGIELLKNGTADFITLFDHRGHYLHYHHRVKHMYHIAPNDTRVWKTVPSTCMTFMTTRQNLRTLKKYFLKYSKGVRDYPLRLWLTKYNLFRIWV